MRRIVESEWLDQLPANDPQAKRSRLDIQRLNLLIGHDRFLAKALKRAFHTQPPRTLADIGAGNGRLLLSVAERLSSHWSNVSVTLVDRVDSFDPQLPERFAEIGWSATFEIADALAWSRNLEQHRVEAVLANHLLHQIRDTELREVFSLWADSVDAVIAAEPRRGLLPLLFSRLVWLVGSAPVTRNDAPLSVRAGFSGKELSVLWPDKEDWELTERRAGWFSHLFVARRK